MRKRKSFWSGRGLRTVLAVVLSVQMSLSAVTPAIAAEVDQTNAGVTAVAAGDLVLDSAWEVENQNNNLVVNNDGSVTITTEKGTIGGEAMKNVLYQKLPNQTDYVFTVKVKGDFTQNYQGAYLMITSGKKLENAVGVVRRYHEYLSGQYGTTMLMGVMQDGEPQEFYKNAEDIGNEFYLRLQKNNGRITGYYAKQYSENVSDWTKIVDAKQAVEQIDKGNSLIAPSDIYIALGAASGGENAATAVTFSDLRIGGIATPLTTDPNGFYSLEISGNTKMEDVNGTTVLSVKGYNASKSVAFTEFTNVTYETSDPNIATVDNKGVVTGKSIGKVKITVKATIGDVTRATEKTIEVGAVVAAQQWKATSPDGKTAITAQLMTDGTLQYVAEQNGAVTIPESPAGIVTSIADFSKNLVFKEVKTQEVNETYTMLSGKKDEYINHCNETTVTFTAKDNAKAEMDFIIRAYDNGTAYRYAVRNTATPNGELKISKEVSGVQLQEGADVYWMNYTGPNWNYEGQYAATTTEGLQVGSTPSIPILFKTGNVWTLFTEADLHGTYSGSMVTVEEEGLLRLTFAKLQASKGDVVTQTPFTSPWRTAITGSPEDIVENTLVENLNPAPDEETYKFSEWVDPGLSSWSWVANWGSGISDQSKASTHLKWIEFGAEIGWDYYILDEGWNVGGRGKVSGMYDWWPTVKKAAADAGVKLWAWVHVSDIDTQEERDRHFSEWAKEGIVGIKPDFFDGESQDIIKLYDDLYRDAAKYKLMVLVHGANKPTGEVRTWPNVYGREAIRGQEAGGITAEQYTLIPFIRAAIGPAEVTEELRSKDSNKTTVGFQIALTSLIEDGIHSMGSAPDVYRDNKLGMEYYTNYPDHWNQTEYVGGEIGKYLSIARRAGSEWYLSGISVDERTMEMPLAFLDADKAYHAIIYQEDGRLALKSSNQAVTAQSTLKIPVLKGGGYAVRFIPGDDIAANAITSIEAPEKLSVEVNHSVVVDIKVAPADAEYKTVEWISEDETIASVVDGKIKGLKQGKTVITVVSAFNKDIKKEIAVTVTPAKFVLNTEKWEVLEQNEKIIINDKDSVTITAEPGVLNEGNHHNLFAMDVPAGNKDFTISAKLSGGIKDNYQGGFVVIFDKNDPSMNHVAAGRRYHGGLMANHPQAFAMMSNGGSAGEFYCADNKADGEVYIRLEKKGNTFTGAYSYDGKTWNDITDKGTAKNITSDNLANSGNLAVGFYTGCGGGTAEIDIKISKFTYNGEAVDIAIPNPEWKDVEDVEKPTEPSEPTKPSEPQMPTLEEQLADVKNQLTAAEEAKNKAEQEKNAAIAGMTAAQNAQAEVQTQLAVAKAELAKAQQNVANAPAIQVGDAAIVGNLVYTVTDVANSTVSVSGSVKSISKVTIPATISLKGKNFNVTEIEDSAFADNKKLTKVVIGANVTTIGVKAFHRASKLKTVQITSTKLTKIGKNAFKGIKKNATIKVPKSNKAGYKKMLKSSKISGSVKVK